MLTKIDASGNPNFHNHEHVYQFEDQESGLFGYIAIHNTNLGSATGGTRWWTYQSKTEALSDALQLSEAMTYKCALAGLKFGGGKAVICGKQDVDRTKALKAYGKVINELRGSFTTGTDVGITDADTSIMATQSSYILGQPSVDVKKYSTSVMAAYGVYVCLSAAYREIYGKINLFSCRVAVKGIGKLGRELVELLVKAGATVTVAETDQKKIDKLLASHPEIAVVDPEQIHKEAVDIYSPCALGGEFNLANIKQIQARIVVGGANNQLQSPQVGDELYKRDIIYLPDYVVNAGGLINIVDELEEGGYNIERVRQRIHDMSQMLLSIIRQSEKEHRPTHHIANQLAEKIFLNTSL